MGYLRVRAAVHRILPEDKQVAKPGGVNVRISADHVAQDIHWICDLQQDVKHCTYKCTSQPATPLDLSRLLLRS